ncbi:succinate:quinone oxidoreductase, FAD binding protein [Gammaproteobacteria bacterium]
MAVDFRAGGINGYIMLTYDVIVVGGGLAGLMSALGTTGQYRVAVFSKVHPLRSHSLAAQGGINAALANHREGEDDDHWEKHAFDTIKSSDYLADQDAVELMCKLGQEVIYQLDHWGAPFSRTRDGKIAQRSFGGAGFPRACYAADRTGHILLHTLFERCVERRVKIFSECLVTGLVVKDNMIQGILALNYAKGEMEVFGARAVVFATGGYGRVYQNTTNALINTGSGIALAYRAGIPIKDLEFVQFHPTTLIGTNILMTEGARGEGGFLINNQGERFMKRYSEKAMELAPRDIVARAISTEIAAGRGFDNACVHLDLRHLGREKIIERLPGIRQICMDFAGVDPIKDSIPIQPGQHYSMGGIDTNTWGETCLSGFYAAGECACVSVHGANRMGGNSLLETVVFGKIVASRIPEFLAAREKMLDVSALELALENEKLRIQHLLSHTGNLNYIEVRDRLRQIMTTHVGIFREEKSLREAVEVIRELKQDYQRVVLKNKDIFYNFELTSFLELEGMLDLGEIITHGALARRESRGSHSRTDFPTRDDINWLRHTMAYYTPNGPRLQYKEVNINRHVPQERKY